MLYNSLSLSAWTITPVLKFEIFFRESSPQTPLLSNEVMDLQVDYWTTGGKKESSKVSEIGQLVVGKKYLKHLF